MGSWWWPAEWQSRGFQDLLQQLRGLTGLCLHGRMPRLLDPVAALAGCSCLRWISDAGPVLEQGAWPAQLRAAHIKWDAALQGTWQSGSAEGLQYLSIASPWIDWGAAPRQPGWAALWAWAAQAPSLRLLEVSVWGRGRPARSCLLEPVATPPMLQLAYMRTAGRLCRAAAACPSRMLRLLPSDPCLPADPWVWQAGLPAHVPVHGALRPQATPPPPASHHSGERG